MKGTWGGTYPLLGKLPRTLILRVAQQFDYASLIGGKAGDLLDDVPDKGRTAGEAALGAADARAQLDGGGFLKKRERPG